MSIVLIGFLASVAAGLATGVGALPALFVRRISGKTQDAMLGFAAGVMLMLPHQVSETVLWLNIAGGAIGIALVAHEITVTRRMKPARA